MELRRIMAAGCAVAGVAVLAGVGWALLAAAVLLAVTPAPRRLLAAGRGVRGAAVSAVRWLATGRRAVATASMSGAVTLLAVGVGIGVGVGAGLAAGGVALGAVSLLSGWNA
jgi:hypothetical protein